MRESRFSEAQIVAIVREYDAGGVVNAVLASKLADRFGCSFGYDAPCFSMP
jgi:hypothetical protein